MSKLEAATAYPLQWPAGWKRTNHRTPSKFSSNFANSRDALMAQLKIMGAQSVVLSSNVPLRNDGLPYANYTGILDPGVAIYFYYKNKQFVVACDKWLKVEDNLHAVNKTIDAIRGIERWGASEMLERAFNGFAQIEAPPSADVKEHWTKVLGVSVNDSIETIKQTYRNLVKIYHEAGSSPDNARMTKINLAYEQATDEKRDTRAA